MTEQHQDSMSFYVSPEEWEAHRDLVESIERTLRGRPDEGHIGLLGRVRRLEKIAWFMAGAIATTLLERIPEWMSLVAGLL